MSSIDQQNEINNPQSLLTRRGFLGAAAALAAVPLLTKLPTAAFAAGSDRIKVGVIGTGGRGTGAARDCLDADPSVQIWALGDVFPDRLGDGLKKIQSGDSGKGGKNNKGNKGNKGGGKALGDDRVASDIRDRCFSGFDAYKKVIASGVDLVILATPPQFRPLHLEEAVRAGKHVFCEKPVAVDPVGARKIISIGELAAQKKLSIVAGTQRRYGYNYNETMKRVRDGAIGEIVGGQCYWMQEGLWSHERKPGWSDMEFQMRNWLYYGWLSGDHIVEQHVHNIDIMNWAMGGPPVKAVGMGGRQSRTAPIYGNIFDHFCVEFEYANGARIMSMCRQAPNTMRRVGERLVGTKGVAIPDGKISGATKWEFTGESPNHLKLEHIALIKSIQNRKPINDAKQIAESTLTAILGRASAYTGKEISYKWMLEASKLDLTPASFALGSAPEVIVPVPGVTPLV